MAETAPAAAAQPAKAPRKKSAAKSTKTGPSVGELVVKVVSASKERSGVSLAALKKALASGGYDVEKNNSRVKIAIKSLVTKGTLVQTKGTGASGSFKLNTKQAETKKPVTKAAPKAKKPAAVAKKPKTAEAKKSPKRAKKPVATAAKKATKSPTKAKKSAAPKKAAKSPKKATKSPMKAKAAKPKTTKPKAAKPKKAAPKKK